MKHIKYIFLAVLFTSTLIISCSSDDEDSNDDPIATNYDITTAYQSLQEQVFLIKLVGTM